METWQIIVWGAVIVLAIYAACDAVVDSKIWTARLFTSRPVLESESEQDIKNVYSAESMGTTLYDQLQISPNACRGVIRAAYEVIKNDLREEATSVENEVRLECIAHAYELLSDSTRRTAYDEGLAILNADSTSGIANNRSAATRDQGQLFGISPKQIIGMAGSIVLFLGVFAPIVSVPIMGSMNYVQNGKGDGMIILILALISFFLALTKRYGGLWITGHASLAVLSFTFINFQIKMSDAKAGMESQLAGNPFRGLADMAMQSVQIQWGWAVLIIGTALVIVSAALKGKDNTWH